MRPFVTASRALLVLLIAPLARAAPPEPFELRDGDRVAFIGNTFFEREQAHSYLETLLASRFPDKNVTFRNLAWSGDTVFGDARAAFETRQEGFERLIKVTNEVKPTVMFICYGMGESFSGEQGLSSFREGLNRLLDRLGGLKARTVLLSPVRHEDLGPPFPNPEQHNRDLRRYADVLKEVAQQRGFRFIDLYDLLGDGTKASPPAPLTDNGIHLTPYGYWRAALAIEQALGFPPRGWNITWDAGSGKIEAKGVEVAGGEKQGRTMTFRTRRELLPPPPLPEGVNYVKPPADELRIVTITGLPEGHWALGCDDALVATGSPEEWAKGIPIVAGPAEKDCEYLRELLRLKNMQFFNRWRPANETYLFGFRRNEQGQNAREIPQFDEPIRRIEAGIAKQRVAPDRTYRLEREDQ